MQDLGHVKVGDEYIFVLYRSEKSGRSLKIRKPARDHWFGTWLGDESAYLNDHPQLVDALKSGKVVKI